MASTWFTGDTIDISDLKVDPARVAKEAGRTHRPVLLTTGGKGIAVLQSLAVYETATEERDFLRGVVKGMADLEEGRELTLAEAKKRLEQK